MTEYREPADERNSTLVKTRANEAEAPRLVRDEKGLTLVGDGMVLRGDFTSTKMLHRVTNNRWQHEMLVKAVKIKNLDHPLRVIDCTAGLGEDSILLVAAGFTVQMFEKDPVIAALCQDALDRARNVPELSEMIARMTLTEGDSIERLATLQEAPDVIYLDPMFPERKKSGQVGKKFQLLHGLEKPCEEEEEMLQAAIDAHPRKVVIKRPLKGALLGGRKPDFSYKGKAIRYDVILLTP